MPAGVYHWKHGWIPLTHAAALSKAHGNKSLAARLVPRKQPQHIADYHAARAAQNRRFEEHAGGGISASDTHTQEFKDYFGVGDHSTTPVEARLSYSEHLKQLSVQKADDRSRKASYDAGHKLGMQHHAAKLPTATENAQYDAAAAHVQHQDHFSEGYSEGLSAAYEKAAAAKGQKVAPINDRHDLAGALKALPSVPSESKKVAADHIRKRAGDLGLTAALPSADRARIAASATPSTGADAIRLRGYAGALRDAPHVVPRDDLVKLSQVADGEHGVPAGTADLAKRELAKRNAPLPKAATTTAEEDRLMQAAAALHYAGSSATRVPTADLHKIKDSSSEYIHPRSRDLAEKEITKRAQAEAASRLAGHTPDDLKALRPKVAGSELNKYQKRAVLDYIDGKAASDAPQMSRAEARDKLNKTESEIAKLVTSDVPPAEADPQLAALHAEAARLNAVLGDSVAVKSYELRAEIARQRMKRRAAVPSARNVRPPTAPKMSRAEARDKFNKTEAEIAKLATSDVPGAKADPQLVALYTEAARLNVLLGDSTGAESYKLRAEIARQRMKGRAAARSRVKRPST